MLRSFLLLLALLLGANAPAALAVEPPPDVLTRTTTQEVITILKQDKELQRGNPAKVHQLVEAKILPNFDFNRMTQLALGKHWPRATAAQKQSLVTEFRNLLVRTYSSSLTAFTDEVIEFKPLTMKPDDTDVTVRSEIRQPGGQPIPINYSFYKTAFGWKVYDVTIDGVSLVTNYRASFASTIRQSGIDGLIKTLAAQSTRGEATPVPRSGS
ncbi:MAG TPA: ABC transporter substrate-binding protein [Thiobacillus sp.]|jgi:phospholipid transport system substrate-binding protein|nr:ABC transporter substrate-binding protein [Thiobacillus sp.]